LGSFGKIERSPIMLGSFGRIAWSPITLGNYENWVRQQLAKEASRPR
jgi:hypothetical protein